MKGAFNRRDVQKLLFSNLGHRFGKRSLTKFL